MNEAGLRAALDQVAENAGPPLHINLTAAMNAGRRQRRSRQTRRCGTVLALSAVAGVITAMLALPGHPVRQVTGGPVPPAAPAAAPRSFDPLVPYAAFGWLPAGWHVGQKSPTFQNDLMATSTSTQLYLPVWAPVGGAELMVFPAGQCRSAAATLLCNWQNTPWRKAGAAPDVSGRHAYWLTETGLAPGTTMIAWQYARGGWAVLDSTNSSPDRSSKALVLSLAAAVRFGRTTQILFPYQFPGMAGSWQVSEVDYTMIAGQPVARMLHLASGRLGMQMQLDVSPPGTVDQACDQQGVVAGTATLDGSRVEILRKGWQLCGDNVDGLQINLFIEDGNGSIRGLAPSPSGPGGVLGYARKLRLLGISQANWTTGPLRV